MYESSFKLARNPFSMVPDPGTMYLSPSHREALAGLVYAIVRRKGFVAVTGEAGTGKTTLLRKALQQIPNNAALTSVLVNPTLTPAEFLELVLLKAGAQNLPASKAARLVMLERILLDANDRRRIPIVVVDEAHKLDAAVFEEIRLLTNFETNEHKLLQIVVAGQPELDGVLNRPDLRQLKQRISVRLHLQSLSPEQTAEYINFRWTNAGGTSPHPFAPAAVSLIAHASSGLPRLINSICDSSLLLAFGIQTATVTRAHVAEVLDDLDLNGSATPMLVPDRANTPVPVPLSAPESDDSVAISAAASVAAVAEKDIVEEDKSEDYMLFRAYMPDSRSPGFFRRLVTRTRP
jgi:general secretion pathway protein A